MSDYDISKACCFTGHRGIDFGERGALTTKVYSTVAELIEKRGTDTFYAGGAIGFDALAAKAVIALRDEKYPHIRLILALPFEGHSSGWSNDKLQEFRLIERFADERVVVCGTPVKSAYFERNRYMVDRSAVCVAYLRKNTGGTIYTVNYAEDKGREIIRV